MEVEHVNLVGLFNVSTQLKVVLSCSTDRAYIGLSYLIYYPFVLSLDVQVLLKKENISTNQDYSNRSKRESKINFAIVNDRTVRTDGSGREHEGLPTSQIMRIMTTFHSYEG